MEIEKIREFIRKYPKTLYITISNNIITKMNNIKILMYLLDNKEQKFSINQISKTLEINYRIAYENVKKLEKEGLIKIEKAGNTNLCSLNNKFNEKIFTAEYQRKQNLFRKKDFKIIYERFAEIQNNFILLLFGSHAKNKSTKHSDIDLLAIGGDKKQLQETIELIPRDIHLTTTSYQNFIEMAKSKEITVGSEAIKNNIPLVGVEDYYRLLKNAQ